MGIECQQCYLTPTQILIKEISEMLTYSVRSYGIV